MSRIYRRGEFLGVGTYTTVFEGSGVLLNQAVAIKVLQPAVAANEAFVRAFLGRSSQMLDVIHEHVLATYPADYSQRPAVIVRELADQTLETLLITSPLPVSSAEEILRQALAGLEALHGRALVHGGIKPRNIFLIGEIFKIGDFGMLSLPAGMPPVPARERRYTAPEILRGEECTPSSDVYALGLVIYELLLGQLRFEAVAEKLAYQAGAGADANAWPAARDEMWPAFHASPLELPSLHQLLTGFPMALSLTLQQMTRKSAESRFADAGQALTSLGAATSPASANGPGTTASPGKIFTGEVQLEAAATRAPGMTGPLQLLAGALAAGLLTVLGWSLARHAPPAVPVSGLAVPLSQGGSAVCSSAGVESATSGAALGTALRELRGTDRSLSIDLEPPAAAVAPWIPVGTPVRFRVISGRPGHLVVFELSADGRVVCLYPNARRPDLPLDGNTEGLVVPLAEDERAFTWRASEPLGLDLVFAVRADQPLLPPEAAASPSPWILDYPWHSAGAGGGASPAKVFAAWVARLRCARPPAVSLAWRDIEVVPNS